MHPLRSRPVLRSVAALVLVGVAATLAPAASARDGRAGAVRALLADGDAFETALAASAEAAPDEDPLDVFVETYVEAAGGGVSAEAVHRLLEGPALGHVAPPVRPAAFVPSPPAGPTSTPGAAVLSPEAAPRAPAASPLGAPPDAPAPSATERWGRVQPRAP